ncbi:MAG: 23S rRNA (adenine(2030)-N(6))-methyltransferase RlmJ [Rhodospirillales bacterium]|nr:23S rRNA (adenine(2030)-N(6))-methyltransferase RlmJ [Rhodospirillales bacterium]
MNYRHAFHAGNFADCLKHAVLHWLFTAMARKEGAIFVLDTHAGAGAYRLDGPEAVRTGEHGQGITRLLAMPAPAALAPWLAAVRRAGEGAYPGSPALLGALLRGQDRMACCELHPEDFAALRRGFRADARIGIHHRDGWAAIGALLPPRERRALVLIDPPYEADGEIARLAEALRLAHARMKGAVLAGWFPIKHRAPLHALRAAIREAGPPDAVEVRFCRASPLDPARLNGAGLVLVNPPFGWEDGLGAILRALEAGLGVPRDAAADTGGAMLRLTDE